MAKSEILETARMAAIEARKPHFIGEKEFDYCGEHFELLYQFPERNNLCIYRRCYSGSLGRIAIEVVWEKGNKKQYPTTNEFGERGLCYTSREKTALKIIKEKFRLPIDIEKHSDIL